MTITTPSFAQLDQQSINTVRFLAVDAVQKANTPGNSFKHFWLRDSAVPSVLVAVWRKWRSWKVKGQIPKDRTVDMKVGIIDEELFHVISVFEAMTGLGRLAGSCWYATHQG